MAAAFEFFVKPCISDFDYCFKRDESSRHHENVGVVVLFDEPADLYIPAEPCADTLMLVEGHLHAVSCTAECDSKVYISVLYRDCQRVSDIRIIHAVSCVCTEVHHFISLFCEILNQPVLVIHASVVVAYTDLHMNFDFALQRYAPKSTKKILCV